ncbi:hypothetical protein [Bradyrhizobium neotropicale]|uniref:hypothetical protein n=1 Tax=Bradyrhizobium neotropicale TaxID=1497615 RepID=UPI001AD64CD0|nr:hypothetical protein [Bradyrhizobium neotropicale]MBO4222007.1 hypothetical protein [Bradyrhizobium neotropicale]
MMTQPPAKKTKQDALYAYLTSATPKLSGKHDLPNAIVGPAGEPTLRRLVSVEKAAAYAGVGRTKMYELIDLEVVKSGHRPGTNRRWVDLDSVDELYRSEDRMRTAADLARKRRNERGKKK